MANGKSDYIWVLPWKNNFKGFAHTELVIKTTLTLFQANQKNANNTKAK